MLSTKMFSIVLAGLMLGGFVSFVQAKKPRSIPSGSWGGQHIQMSVVNGSARIEYDCANGTISGPLRIGRGGRFSLLGRHVREHGGPIRMGENRDGAPARYTGWTDGKTMKLTVTLVDTRTEIGTFELTRGKEGRIFKCR